MVVIIMISAVQQVFNILSPCLHPSLSSGARFECSIATIVCQIVIGSGAGVGRQRGQLPSDLQTSGGGTSDFEAWQQTVLLTA